VASLLCIRKNEQLAIRNIGGAAKPILRHGKTDRRPIQPWRAGFGVVRLFRALAQGIAMSNDQLGRQWFAILGTVGWVETDDSPVLRMIPEAVEKIALGDPVNDRDTPIIWIFEDVDPGSSEDDPTGEMGDEVSST